jgi:hypothetical protein
MHLNCITFIYLARLCFDKEMRPQMKIKPSRLTFAFMAFVAAPALAQAQAFVTATGVAFSGAPPDCDGGSFARAGEAAGQDAARQCQGIAKRNSEYTMKCDILAHGYAARAQASAEYECQLAGIAD